MKQALSRDRLLRANCAREPVGGRLTSAALAEQLAELQGWSLDDGVLVRNYSFSDYRSTISFVDAVAEIAEREDHHPELRVGYGHCEVRWSTHSVGGVSLNDFVCAAKTDALADAGGAQAREDASR